MNKIHPTAIVYENVILGKNVEIGPYCVISGRPEHRDFYNNDNYKGVIIGDNVKIYSFVTIDAGTIGNTIIGDNCAIFTKSHIAHDCDLGVNVTIGGDVSLAGHTWIQDHATISGKSCTFQGSVIGAHSFIGGMSFVTKHVPPGEKWMGYPARNAGINEVGLSRKNLTYEECLRKYLNEYKYLTEHQK